MSGTSRYYYDKHFGDFDKEKFMELIIGKLDELFNGLNIESIEEDIKYIEFEDLKRTFLGIVDVDIKKMPEETVADYEERYIENFLNITEDIYLYLDEEDVFLEDLINSNYPLEDEKILRALVEREGYETASEMFESSFKDLEDRIEIIYEIEKMSGNEYVSETAKRELIRLIESIIEDYGTAQVSSLFNEYVKLSYLGEFADKYRINIEEFINTCVISVVELEKFKGSLFILKEVIARYLIG